MKRKREADMTRALPSAASLIIVPEILLNQWREQIDLYVHAHIVNSNRIYIDDDLTRELPTSDKLSYYYIIVTTHKRLALEWKTGRPLVYNDVKVGAFLDEFYGSQLKVASARSKKTLSSVSDTAPVGASGGPRTPSKKDNNMKKDDGNIVNSTSSNSRSSIAADNYSDVKAAYRESSLLGLVFYRLVDIRRTTENKHTILIS
jgi:hypothetical protein